MNGDKEAEMTAAEKIQALIQSGLADDKADAAAQLLDMGEISQAAADRYSGGGGG